MIDVKQFLQALRAADAHNLGLELGNEEVSELRLILTDFRSRITNLEAENAALKERLRWIPVEERLPEKDEIVFVLLNGGDGDDIDWIDDTGTWWSNENVTHWMPRPEEPKEGGEK